MSIISNNIVIYNILLLSILVSFSGVTFILDGFRFSKNIYIKYLQYISLSYMIFFFIKYRYLLFNLTLENIKLILLSFDIEAESIFNFNIAGEPNISDLEINQNKTGYSFSENEGKSKANESINKTPESSLNNNKVTVKSSVTVSEEGAQIIGDSIRHFSNYVGLGASIGGVAAAVGGTVAKSQASPVKKTGLTILGGLAGGLIHFNYF